MTSTVAGLIGLLGPNARAGFPEIDVASTVNLPPEIVDINHAAPSPWGEGKATRRQVAGEVLAGAPGNVGWSVDVVSLSEKTTFTPMPDIGRMLALIGGHGIVVQWKPPHRVRPHQMDELLKPYYFSGDVNLEPLAPGTVSDLIHVVTNRKYFHGDLTPIREGLVSGSDEMLMVYCAYSTLNIYVAEQNVAVLKAGQAAIWRNGSPTLKVIRSSQNGGGVVVRVNKVKP